MRSKTKIVFSFQLPKSLQEPFQVWDSIVWQQSECERVSDEKLNYERCQVSQGCADRSQCFPGSSLRVTVRLNTSCGQKSS